MVDNIRLSPGACFLGALAILMLPVRWWMGALLAAVVHELSHLTAILLTGGQVIGLAIGPMGAEIEALPMCRGREAICAAAGPLGSILTAVNPFFPEASICAAVQAVFNLLPVYPLDGGRFLRSIAPEPVCFGVALFTVIMLIGTGLWCSVFLNLGVFPLIPGAAAAFRAFPRKTPCKEPKFAIQ